MIGLDVALDQRFRLPENVSSRKVENELVLLNLDDGNFHVASGLGPVIWQLLVDGMDLDEVIRSVSERYQQDAAQVRADVEAFVADLLDKGLLVVVSQPP